MGLTSVAAPIWNQIAKEGNLRTEWARKAFALDPDKMASLEDAEYKALLAKGVPQPVAMGYLDLKPLLLENVAISRHIQKTQQTSLRTALPEVTTLNEAIMLASMERPLNPSQQMQLRQLLQSDFPKSAN